MQHAPAKLPFNLHMFAHVKYLAQSLCIKAGLNHFWSMAVEQVFLCSVIWPAPKEPKEPKEAQNTKYKKIIKIQYQNKEEKVNKKKCKNQKIVISGCLADIHLKNLHLNWLIGNLREPVRTDIRWLARNQSDQLSPDTSEEGPCLHLLGDYGGSTCRTSTGCRTGFFLSFKVEPFLIVLMSLRIKSSQCMLRKNDHISSATEKKKINVKLEILGSLNPSIIPVFILVRHPNQKAMRLAKISGPIRMLQCHIPPCDRIALVGCVQQARICFCISSGKPAGYMFLTLFFGLSQAYAGVGMEKVVSTLARCFHIAGPRHSGSSTVVWALNYLLIGLEGTRLILFGHLGVLYTYLQFFCQFNKCNMCDTLFSKNFSVSFSPNQFFKLWISIDFCPLLSQINQLSHRLILNECGQFIYEYLILFLCTEQKLSNCDLILLKF
ncbi:hypothetical protein VP01_803g1 [Puccinia sorghi]|uniref:Uncharacterized protein n=1 Tax=Puccinia sorghi TaxID=27349 RepID=A0A0L6UAH2_9BASI|nr:hypothetical protein VP01_803g1 [Puccinia sorghi]